MCSELIGQWKENDHTCAKLFILDVVHTQWLFVAKVWNIVVAIKLLMEMINDKGNYNNALALERPV